MKQFAQILASLVVGTAFLFALTWAGFGVTLVVTRKSPYDLVWIVGGYYIPFFIGGFVLALARGFKFPRIFVPLCALFATLILPLLNAYNIELSEILEPEFYLPFLAIPLAFAGCLVSQTLFASTESEQALKGKAGRQ